MLTYIYGCTEHKDVRKEVVHAMNDNPVIPCPRCSQPMHRIPQAVRHYTNPQDVLFDQLDARYRAYRAKKARTK